MSLYIIRVGTSVTSVGLSLSLLGFVHIHMGEGGALQKFILKSMGIHLLGEQ